MDHNYYKISDIYKKKVLLKEYSGQAPVNDTKNSYQTTASMSGPGNGPSTGSDGQNAQYGDRVMFPNDEELSIDQEKQLLIKYLKHAIDSGKWDKKTEDVFGHMMNHLSGVDTEEDDVDEPELK